MKSRSRSKAVNSSPIKVQDDASKFAPDAAAPASAPASTASPPLVGAKEAEQEEGQELRVAKKARGDDTEPVAAQQTATAAPYCKTFAPLFDLLNKAMEEHDEALAGAAERVAECERVAAAAEAAAAAAEARAADAERKATTWAERCTLAHTVIKTVRDATAKTVRCMQAPVA